MSDKFSHMTELLRSVRSQGNYKFEIDNSRGSKIKLFAPHGGCIEPCTGRIVKSIARGRWDYFIFRGTRRDGCYDTLHVTSTNYDEPRCLGMAENAVLAVSIHGCCGDGNFIEVGGGNTHAVDDLIRYLVHAGFRSKPASAAKSGSDERNFVNKAHNKGVQLELTDGFREFLFSNYPTKPRINLATFPAFIRTLQRWIACVEERI